MDFRAAYFNAYLNVPTIIFMKDLIDVCNQKFPIRNFPCIS